MKILKWIIIILAIGILLGVSACNLFSDDYIWDDWVTAIVNTKK